MLRAGPIRSQTTGTKARQKAPPIRARQANTERKSYFHRPGRAALYSTSHPSSTSARAGASLSTSCQLKAGQK